VCGPNDFPFLLQASFLAKDEFFNIALPQQVTI
jgi:hypothetical protein